MDAEIYRQSDARARSRRRLTIYHSIEDEVLNNLKIFFQKINIDD